MIFCVMNFISEMTSKGGPLETTTALLITRIPFLQERLLLHSHSFNV